MACSLVSCFWSASITARFMDCSHEETLFNIIDGPSIDIGDQETQCGSADMCSPRISNPLPIPTTNRLQVVYTSAVLFWSPIFRKSNNMGTSSVYTHPPEGLKGMSLPKHVRRIPEAHTFVYAVSYRYHIKGECWRRSFFSSSSLVRYIP